MRKVLAIILWAGIPFCWQPLWGQTPSVEKSDQNQKKQPTLGAGKANNDQRGTDATPLVIETQDRNPLLPQGMSHDTAHHNVFFRNLAHPDLIC